MRQLILTGLLMMGCGATQGVTDAGPSGGGHMGGGTAAGGGAGAGGGGGGGGTTCQPPQHLCGAQCLPNSIQACGPSCEVCRTGPHGSPTCDGRICGFACETGFTNVGGECRPSWTEKTQTSSPTARKGAAMAYDARRQRAVMFGGSIHYNWFNETWEWDGTNWTQRSPGSSPTARQYATMAYNADRGTSVLYGGNLFSDTWEWDGTNWKEVYSSGPTERSQPAMAYEPTSKSIFLYGGFEGRCDAGCGSTLGDLWVLSWDAGVPADAGIPAWHRLTQASSPTDCALPTMAFDETLGRMVLSCSQGTWGWNGQGWDRLGDGTLTAIFFYAPRLHASVSTGYWNFYQAFQWADGGWTTQNLLNAPERRQWPAAAYDTHREVLVVFGGYSDSRQDGGAPSELGDTWELPTWAP